jgi:Cu/Ag efflux pump CusA
VPQARIAMNRAAMARYGVTPAYLAEAIDVAFAGEVANQVLEGQQSYDLVVRFDSTARGNLERIAQARFDTPQVGIRSAHRSGSKVLLPLRQPCAYVRRRDCRREG